MYYSYGILAILPVILLSLIIQLNLNKTYVKYSSIDNSKGMTGGQMAEYILRNAGIYDVTISCIGGRLSDHFDPTRKVVCLSERIYHGTGIAAIGVAAHECGHAIQHHEAYAPVRIRSAVVGVTNLSSRILYFLMIASLFFSGYSFGGILFDVAIICYLVIFFFQLITLPVEFNASNRAVKIIRSSGFSEDDMIGVKKVLVSAALTYVASAVTALWQLILMISRSQRRR